MGEHLPSLWGPEKTMKKSIPLGKSGGRSGKKPRLLILAGRNFALAEATKTKSVKKAKIPS